MLARPTKRLLCGHVASSCFRCQPHASLFYTLKKNLQELNKNKTERKRARDEKLGEEDTDELKGRVRIV